MHLVTTIRAYFTPQGGEIPQSLDERLKDKVEDDED